MCNSLVCLQWGNGRGIEATGLTTHIPNIQTTKGAAVCQEKTAFEGARHFCQKHGLSLVTPIKVSDLLDAVLQAAPDVVVRAIIDHVARPLVKEAKIEQVEPADVSGTVPQEAS